MKISYYLLYFFLLLYSSFSFSNEHIEYDDWIKNEQFSKNLVNKIDDLINLKVNSKTESENQTKKIKKIIISNLNFIANYQNQYTKLRSFCSDKFGDINFESTASGTEYIIFAASFRFSYFELKTVNENTGAITQSFQVSN